MSAVIHTPIFPLPDVVLFPHTLLPLHIFEPRYRQMVQECLAGDKRLAMALLKPGWEHDYYGRPPVHPIAGAGEIVRHEELADGRFNILVRGTMRIGILSELPPDKPYRMVRARPLPDRYSGEDTKSLADRVERLKVFYLRILAEVQKGQGEVAKIFSGVKDPGIILDRIAGAAIPEAEIRQQVLEAVEVPMRLVRVQEQLLEVLTRISDRNAPAERSGGRHN
ncbi:MAG TPA: LON peptidase substrate-binding domain-containing protein [Candidatus Methylomirabilis sp.]|nr:LON peptidase substrate-binding domain-containing protein [Candidatus Methylomirabilis sp.]HSC70611.1 LON peptidase substrate-binding domain-containing protein [Candidatus Methylomirabilis sp.]